MGGFAPSETEHRCLRSSIRVSAQHRAVKGESVGDSQIAQRTIFENTASRLESSNPAKTESWPAADHQCDVAQSQTEREPKRLLFGSTLDYA